MFSNVFISYLCWFGKGPNQLSTFSLLGCCLAWTWTISFHKDFLDRKTIQIRRLVSLPCQHTDPVCWKLSLLGPPWRNSCEAVLGAGLSLAKWHCLAFVSCWILWIKTNDPFGKESYLSNWNDNITAKTKGTEKSLNLGTAPSPKLSQLDKRDDYFQYKAKLEMQLGWWQGKAIQSLSCVKYQQSQEENKKCFRLGTCILMWWEGEELKNEKIK